MTIFPLSLKSNAARNRKHDLQVSSLLLDRQNGLYIEEHFNEILRMEKRRAERSGKHFLLMQLKVERLLEEANQKELLGKISFALFASTRDIDIKGWYRHGEVIGVIFAEIRNINRELIRQRIFRKVYKSLCKLLNLEILSCIEISFHFFPERPAAQKSSRLHQTSQLNQQTTTGVTPGAVAEPRAAVLPLARSGHGSPQSRPQSQPQSQSKPRNVDEQAEQNQHSRYQGESKQVWLLLVGDLLFILIATALSTFGRFGYPIDAIEVYTGATALSFTVYPTVLYIFDMYNPERVFHSRETLLRTFFAVVMGGFLLAFLFYFIPQWQYGRGIMVLHLALAWVLMSGWRMLYGASFQIALPKVDTLVLGAGKSGQAIYPLLESPLSPYEVKGFLDDDPGKQGEALGATTILGGIDRLLEIADQNWIKAAILAMPRNGTAKHFRSILEARLRGMEILEMPAVYERLTGRVPVQHIEDQWFLFTDGFNLLSGEYVQRLKRILDLFASGILILLTAPIMAVTALAILLDSKGPVFYKQDRIGKGGKVFSVHKFRSMHQNAEAHGAVWAERDDPRITRVGRLIRFSRIDELPQLWNVFNGDMSLVGPRPERPEFVRDLEKKIPYYYVRHSVQPGITGWAQINYPYGASVEDALRKLEYDLYYIKNMSILLDVKILLRTVGVVLLGEGAR